VCNNDGHRASHGHGRTNPTDSQLVASDMTRMDRPPSSIEARTVAKRTAVARNVMDRRRLVALFAAVVLAGCAGPGPLPSSGPSSGWVGGPPIAPSGSPAASPTSGAFDPDSAEWVRLGAGRVGPGGGDLIGFDHGYVSVGTRDPFEEPVAWFSADGLSWDTVSLAKQVPNCPGWGPPGNENVPDADTAARATNGRQVIVVGAWQPHDAAACSGADPAIQGMAWLSEDGRTWRRSEPFSTGASGRATAVWPVRHGWRAVVGRSVWESADGLRWSSIGDLAGIGAVSAYAGPAADGTAVLSATVGAVGFEQVRLFSSPDGASWTAIDDAGGCEIGATQILAPSLTGLAAWVVLSDRRVCTSTDLVRWNTEVLPMAVWQIAQTRYGAIAIGDTCLGVGRDCPDPGVRATITLDGIRWSQLAHPQAWYGRSLADGPAGVLLIGSGPDDVRPSAWLLRP
jgi:hypothetical protein